MGRIDNLRSDEVAKNTRGQRQLQAQSPLGYSSVSRGALRIRSAEGLLVEGSERVTGTWYLDGVGWVDGTLNVDGSLDVNGTTTITGPLVVNGSFNVTSLAVSMSAASVFVSTLTSSGLVSVGGNLNVIGTLTNAGVPGTTGSANTIMTVGGLLQRITSAARFKIDAQKMDLPDALLDVPVEWWFDLGNSERYAELLEQPRPFTAQQQAEYDDPNSLRRIPGVIAEKVRAAGGEAFVGLDADGRIESVLYDRLAIARTELLAKRLDAALARICELEAKLV